MKPTFMRRWIPAIVYLFGFLCTPVIASPYSDLKLQIKAEKENLVLGEPLLIESSIINLSDEAVNFSMGGPPEFFISKDGLSFSYYRDSEVAPIYKPTFVELKPGEIKNLGKSTVLYYVSQVQKKVVFDVPGEYFVKAKYYVTPSNLKDYITLESDRIKIKVIEPSGIDKKIWDMICHNIEFVKFIHHGYASKQNEDEVIKTLKQIIEKYPASTYTPYIKEALIKYYRRKPDKTSEEKEYLKTLQKD